MPVHAADEPLHGWENQLIKVVISVVAITFSLFHLYIAGVGIISIAAARHIHLMLAMSLVFLNYPLSKKSPRHWTFAIDVVLILLALTVGVYLEIEYEQLFYRLGEPTTLDFIFGVITILLTLEMTRRVIGVVLILVVFIFIAYNVFGNYVPGYLGHKGDDFVLIVDRFYTQLRGIYGMPLGVAVKYVVIFIVFGSFLQETGAGDFFTKLAFTLTGGMRGGPAKTAVIASGLMGSISGSATANVVTTGSFTIPMMKKIGYPPHIAGGVEVASSVGGILLPPIMGAAAFLIVALTGIPYVDVIKAAALPSLLYYISVFSFVHFVACKHNILGVPIEGNYWKNLLTVLWQGVYYLIPLALLVILLLSGYSPTYSAFYSLVCLVAISFLRKESRMGFRDFAQALERAARNSLTVSTACACVGMVVGVVSLTGVGIKFSSLIVTGAAGNIVLAVVFVGLASLVLGIELPVSASYLVVAILAAPALDTLGIPLLVAHLIVLWYSVDAAVTPPVCITSYVGAGVAKADPFKTAISAWKIAKGLYLIPILMIFTPITLNGTFPKIVTAFMTGSVAMISFSAAWEGYLITRTTLIERTLLGAVVLAAFFPGSVRYTVCLPLFAAVLIKQWFSRRQAALTMESARSTR